MTEKVIRVATLNVRNTADRWLSRRHLLAHQLVALAPDIIGLQELRRFPSQGRWIVDRVEALSRGALRLDRRPAWKTGGWAWWEGIAVLSRLEVADHDVLALGGQGRIAQRLTVRLDANQGGELDFYNTHLASGDRAMKQRQAARLVDWMATREGRAQVLVGDFNSGPGSPAVAVVESRMQSAFALAHGREPEWTAPTALRRSSAPDHERKVLDYVFVDDRVRVIDARLAFDRPGPADPSLMASDHLGLVAALSLGDRPQSQSGPPAGAPTGRPPSSPP